MYICMYICICIEYSIYSVYSIYSIYSIYIVYIVYTDYVSFNIPCYPPIPFQRDQRNAPGGVLGLCEDHAAVAAEASRLMISDEKVPRNPQKSSEIQLPRVNYDPQSSCST